MIHPPEQPTFTIFFKPTGKKVDGLQIEDVIEPPKGVDAETSVLFLTKAKKRWKIRLSEFSFVFNSTTKQAA